MNLGKSTKIQNEISLLLELDRMYKTLSVNSLFILCMYIFLYSFFQVWPMVFYCLISIPVYAFLTIKKFHKMMILYITILHSQIIFMSFLSVIIIGWQFEFQIIILAMISTAYINRKNLKINLIFLPIVESFIYILARIITLFVEPPFPPNQILSVFQSESIMVLVISLINIFVALFCIFSIASVTKSTNNLSYDSLYEKNATLQKLANIDPLTKLLNRRYVYEYVEKMENKAYEFIKHNNFIVVIGDIDDFKDVNDTCGHETGDLVLKKIAEIMKHSLRDIDLICRWGGEEFLIIMPDITVDEGYKIINDIRSYISQKAFHYNKYRFIVTMTFGISNADHDTKFNEALAIADEKLYRGKNSGKNQVVI